MPTKNKALLLLMSILTVNVLSGKASTMNEIINNNNENIINNRENINIDRLVRNAQLVLPDSVEYQNLVDLYDNIANDANDNQSIPQAVQNFVNAFLTNCHGMTKEEYSLLINAISPTFEKFNININWDNYKIEFSDESFGSPVLQDITSKHAIETDTIMKIMLRNNPGFSDKNDAEIIKLNLDSFLIKLKLLELNIDKKFDLFSSICAKYDNMIRTNSIDVDEDKFHDIIPALANMILYDINDTNAHNEKTDAIVDNVFSTMLNFQRIIYDYDSNKLSDSIVKYITSEYAYYDDDMNDEKFQDSSIFSNIIYYYNEVLKNAQGTDKKIRLNLFERNLAEQLKTMRKSVIVSYAELNNVDTIDNSMLQVPTFDRDTQSNVVEFESLLAMKDVIMTTSRNEKMLDILSSENNQVVDLLNMVAQKPNAKNENVLDFKEFRDEFRQHVKDFMSIGGDQIITISSVEDLCNALQNDNVFIKKCNINNVFGNLSNRIPNKISSSLYSELYGPLTLNDFYKITDSNIQNIVKSVLESYNIDEEFANTLSNQENRELIILLLQRDSDISVISEIYNMIQYKFRSLLNDEKLSIFDYIKYVLKDFDNSVRNLALQVTYDCIKSEFAEINRNNKETLNKSLSEYSNNREKLNQVMEVIFSNTCSQIIDLLTRCNVNIKEYLPTITNKLNDILDKSNIKFNVNEIVLSKENEFKVHQQYLEANTKLCNLISSVFSGVNDINSFISNILPANFKYLNQTQYQCWQQLINLSAENENHEEQENNNNADNNENHEGQENNNNGIPFLFRHINLKGVDKDQIIELLNNAKSLVTKHFTGEGVSEEQLRVYKFILATINNCAQCIDMLAEFISKYGNEHINTYFDVINILSMMNNSSNISKYISGTPLQQYKQYLFANEIMKSIFVLVSKNNHDVLKQNYTDIILDNLDTNDIINTLSTINDIPEQEDPNNFEFISTLNYLGEANNIYEYQPFYNGNNNENEDNNEVNFSKPKFSIQQLHNYQHNNNKSNIIEPYQYNNIGNNNSNNLAHSIRVKESENKHNIANENQNNNDFSLCNKKNIQYISNYYNQQTGTNIIAQSNNSNQNEPNNFLNMTNNNFQQYYKYNNNNVNNFSNDNTGINNEQNLIDNISDNNAFSFGTRMMTNINNNTNHITIKKNPIMNHYNENNSIINEKQNNNEDGDNDSSVACSQLPQVVEDELFKKDDNLSGIKNAYKAAYEEQNENEMNNLQNNLRERKYKEE